MGSDLAYYSARAQEYERIYSKPERQDQLRELKATIGALFAGQSVLEVACGTGYWTQYIARTAKVICATDLSEETLAVAMAKGLDENRVRFLKADAMALPVGLGQFDSAFCGFWWSHVARSSIAGFLDTLHARLRQGARVVVLDNKYVEGSSTAISRRSPAGDTYQIRQLSDGSTHEVLKNFPSEPELRAQLNGRAANIKYAAWQHYWLLEYEPAA
jgi:ubiquinone/menaquinone biosynthesis C-methylase UbiE